MMGQQFLKMVGPSTLMLRETILKNLEKVFLVEA